MGTADTLRPRFAQPEKAYLALFDESRHRADGLFDRHGGINPVLVIEIDDLDAESLEAGLAGLGNVGRAAIDAVGTPRLACLAKFARDHDTVAPALQCPAEQFLVLTPAIH